MQNDNDVMMAYLYLSALERQGAELGDFDIHAAWVAHCQRHSQQPGFDLVYAAQSAGFSL